MLLVWENETRITARSSEAEVRSSDSDRARWATYAGSRALSTYHLARQRWQGESSPEILGDIKPDERFFDAAISSLARRWRLQEPKKLFANQRTELSMVLSDMDDFHIEVPEALRNRLWVSNPDWKGRKLHVQALAPKDYRVWKRTKPEKKEREFAAVLADMQLAGMGAMGLREWDCTKELLEGDTAAPSARA